MRTVRIHGDNIVECERALAFFESTTPLINKKARYVSAAVIEVEGAIGSGGAQEEIRFQMFPGFNKSNRRRWKADVFSVLREAGSFLEETPDAVITSLSDDGQTESVLCAIEFCSALQAGNQAWQRSGRAYSAMRAGCPYLYVVDFPKYELDGDRKRKALRFPNAAIPYSYAEAAKSSPAFGAQVFFPSEEYDRVEMEARGFKNETFGDDLVGAYLNALILGKSTAEIERGLLERNLEMVEFFSKEAKASTSFEASDWEKAYASPGGFLAVAGDRRLPWKKKIAAKSASQHTSEVLAALSSHAVGMGSNDLPIALVPSENVEGLLKDLAKIDSEVASRIREQIDVHQPLVVCAVKGFKPRGDDNRPDRGVLPLAAMLAGEDTQILTYIYGPISSTGFATLRDRPTEAMKRSGFWNVFLALSNVVLVDSPVTRAKGQYHWGVIGSSDMKTQALERSRSAGNLTFASVPIEPNSVHEDDVDAVLHTCFAAIPETLRFEGLCNPPRGRLVGTVVDG